MCAHYSLVFWNTSLLILRFSFGYRFWFRYDMRRIGCFPLLERVKRSCWHRFWSVVLILSVNLWSTNNSLYYNSFYNFFSGHCKFLRWTILQVQRRSLIRILFHFPPSMISCHTGGRWGGGQREVGWSWRLRRRRDVHPPTTTWSLDNQQ